MNDPKIIETEEVMPSDEYDNLLILECVDCKGRLFTVARGDYVTYAKCVQCGTQEYVHAG